MRQYSFDTFTLQLEQRRLLGADGTEIELTPRLFDALLYFVQNAGQLLDKDRLMSELWPDVVVEENSLSQSVSALRKALGDDAQSPRFIQTVPRRGFRFVAAVVASDAEAAPVVPVAPVAPVAPVIPASEAIAVDAPAAPPRRRWLAGAAAGAVLATAVGATAVWRWRQQPTLADDGTPRTLAVLPFKPIAAGTPDELLEFGMADSLVSRLSNLPGVAVRSIGSVRRFAGAEQDTMAAARELGVTWIVDGTVQREAGRVRVTARLLNTTSGEAAWSGSFDEQFTGMFNLQDSISAKVAQVLAPHLGARGQRRLSGPGGTRNVDAYQLYLAAQQHAQGIRTAGLVKAVALYEQAIALDPNYALAYSGMAEAYRRMVFGADGEPAVVLTAAQRCNNLALRLDPDLAAAHSGKGWNLFWQQWDWPAAQAAFDHALALNASESNAHLGYSQLLETLGRKPEALEHLRLARESDPLSLILLTLESGSLVGAGRIDEARQRLQRVLDIEPDFWVAHMVRSAFFFKDGDAAGGIDALVRADQLADGSSQAAASLGYALARKGQPARARGVLQRLLDQAKTRYVPPTSAGLIHAGLGDKPAALQALETGLAVRDVRMTLVGHDGRWALLRDEPRYGAVMKAMRVSSQPVKPEKTVRAPGKV